MRKFLAVLWAVYIFLATIDLLKSNLYFQDYWLVEIFANITYEPNIHLVLFPGEILAFIALFYYGVVGLFFVQIVLLVAGVLLCLKLGGKRKKANLELNETDIIDSEPM